MLSRELLESLNDLIHDLFHMCEMNEYVEKDLLAQELFGYKSTIPRYRIFYSEVVADYESKGTVYHEKKLRFPSRMRSYASFLNMNQYHIYSGLLHLSNDLEDLLEIEMEDSLIVMLNMMFNGDILVTRAKQVVSEDKIEYMLMKIRERFGIKENSFIKEEELID